ncbi:MAG: hypothetical protein JSS64_06695 [Bacteroidetes bacterium]|nr:hypothetical protein [Bacteroidota bacterium]MBS1775953.1 hypothetical protein [Bacteroidota bacterium]
MSFDNLFDSLKEIIFSQEFWRGGGVAGAINFNTSSKHAELLYPTVKRHDTATESNIDFSHSALKAGIHMTVDNMRTFGCRLQS